jgi:hypothetical protein
MGTPFARVKELDEAAASGRSTGTVAPRILTIFIALIATVVVVSGVLYVASPSPPYGFYWDLGGNIVATALIANWIHGLPDAIDSIGWAGWGNIDSFPFHPMLSVFGRVLLMPLFHNDAVTVIKCVQALEVPLAVASMAALYAMLRGWSAWAWAAGFVYALLPESLLMIRGNVDFGLAIALAPLCIGVPFALARRYGPWSLPLCGAIAGLLSSCLVLEFLFVHGMPAYLLAVAVAFRRRVRLTWILMAIIGLGCFMLSGAYFIFPSLAMGSLFTLPVPAVANLQSGQGGGFAMFGETPVPFFSLALSEFFNASVPDFSLEPLLWLTLPLGISLCGLAVWRVAWAPASGRLNRGELALALMGVVCAILSLGAWSPLVLLFWRVISQVPLLNNMRTPDRLISLAIIVFVLFAVFALEQLAARGALARRLALAACGIFFAAGLYALFWTRLFLGDPMPLSFRFPHLQAVNAITAKRGGRVANLSEVFLGRSGFSILYGIPQPFDAFQDDFFQRYESDGFGGSEVLARAGVNTFITTPRWATDSPYFPETVRHSIDLQRIAGSPWTASVWAVKNPRPEVASVNIVCFRGGPGLFEYALALRRFADDAFLTSASCARTIYSDTARMSKELGGDVEGTFSGIDLFPHNGQMRDDDYRITLGRWFINLPWYRNAIDGDSPRLGAAAVSVTEGNSARTTIEIPKSANYDLALRIVCHVAVAGTLSIDASHARSFACAPRLGFQWVEVAFGRLERGHYVLRLTIQRLGAASIATSSLLAPFWSVGFDGLAVVARHTLTTGSPAAYLFSLHHFDDALGTPAPSKATIAAAARTNLVPGATSWSGYRSGSALTAKAATARLSTDRRANAPRGAAVKISFPGTATGSVGLDGPRVLLHANTLYEVSYYARASVAHTDFSSASVSGGVIITPTVMYATSYADTDWHKYSFDWLVGPKDVHTRVRLATGLAYADTDAPADAKETVWIASPNLTKRPSAMHVFSARRWLGAGAYCVRTFLLGAIPGGDMYVDGRRIADGACVTLGRSGYHALRYIGVPEDAYAVALTPAAWGTASQRAPSIHVEKLTSQRWRVVNDKVTTLEAAVFPDGWWYLKGSDGRSIGGTRCDIVNTCFMNVPPGKYLLAHAWPSYVSIGLAGTAAAWIVAALIVWVAMRRREGQAAKAA